ncbi:selenium-dependent molybdenum cofactor biosynthesis protein YqeB [Salidesulfovibrio onnuriiensis]|uniref:selenium-dependent molybdenum cofactor biosynthesis protein YqeB n=1 Tax=Salidesulfovibrio onnuriiensis TaxID=2583823 RepID=UPI0011CCB16F|nr:selenium-dependent molybdenum cofactor biosynthesis protein YqeB [Salidesulfovibrio onnuriiensis]
MTDLTKLTIVVRSAGDLATGIVLRLYRSGFKRIVMLEVDRPLAVRRRVAFSEAVWLGENIVEGVTARMVPAADIEACWAKGELPVVVDPEGETVKTLRPDVVVDAIMAKRNLGTSADDADLVIGIGPGFSAGNDVHYVIETCRGHHLGRVIREGEALPNTNVPGMIEGFAIERLLRAPVEGLFETTHDIGDRVAKGATVGTVNGEPVIAAVAGVLRGLLRTETPTPRGMKLGDIDPRDQVEFCDTASDKAIAIGGGVLEAVLEKYNRA